MSVLIGRDREVRALAERIDAASDPLGGALLLRGPAGIGKSSLLEAARAHAKARRFVVLSTTGIQSQSQLPFAGLHQLLRPILHDVDRLPDAYGNAIRTAFGLSEGAAPTPYLIGLTLLHLLGESSESTPVLLLVDDAHWLDHPSAEALAFVARRLESDPVVMLAGLRDGFENPLLGARIPELAIAGLSGADARSLLEVRAPGLTPALRSRVLKEAAGNPLALIELSAAQIESAGSDEAPSATSLPLTDRLVLAFAGRLSSLDPVARSLLHVAGTDESGVLAELLAAASRLAGEEVGLRAAAEASRAGFIEVDGPHLRFRHPLMRAAIHRAMSVAERQAAHAALAVAFEGDPDRRTWHRAASALGTDEQVATELEGVADRAWSRGAGAIAIEALERAAQLSDDPRRRGTRLVQALHTAAAVGRSSDVVRLLKKIDDAALGPLDRPRAAWLRELYAEGSWSGASRIASFVAIADQIREGGDVEGGIAALKHIALRCWWSNPDVETRALVIAAVERFPLADTDAGVLNVLALAGPEERGSVVLERLARRISELPTSRFQPYADLGLAAIAVGDFANAERMLEADIVRGRKLGWLGGLVASLGAQAWTKIQLGDWKQAASLASETSRLAEETGPRNWVPAANLATATIAAYRGDVAAAEKLAAAAEEALLPRGANPMLAMVQYPRGAAALADGRHEEAFQHLRRIFDPADIAYHPHVRSWALVDLVEAAAHSGHERDAAALVNELEALAARTRSPLLLSALAFARPVLSSDHTEAAFHAGLGAGLTMWPFTRARLQLAYGLWLRRHRRPADARAPLRAARDAFDALGAVPWSERARQELRASGETSRRRSHDLADALSPQELQIAQLAATGLSNKEIGQQLFLSHRTVGFHLYRIFPKLGITARSHLSAALQDRSTERPS